MNLIQFLILQFIAHILTDFFFQPDNKAKEKNSLGFRSKYIKWHILISFGLSWLFSFQLTFILGSLVIAITHWIVDGAKKFINSHKKSKKYAFYVDQILHLFFIFIVVLLFDKLIGIKPLFTFPIEIRPLLIITGYLVCTKPSNILIKEIFISSSITINENNDLPNAGKLIGTIERLLTLTFILLNQFEVVGFFIAAKSILRFKNDDALKTEYVLIGTMLSFGIAIALGIAINLLEVNI